MNRLLYATLVLATLLRGSTALGQSDLPFDRSPPNRELSDPEPYAQNSVDRGRSDQPSYRDERSDLVRFDRVAETLIAQRIEVERARFSPDAPRLAPDPDLTDIARERSETMAHGARFSHQDQNGRFVAADMVRERFGPYGAIGENIMEMYGSQSFTAAAFADRAVSGWMASPGHRANILSPDYRSSGIGVALNGDYAYATQVFRGPPKGTAAHPPL